MNYNKVMFSEVIPGVVAACSTEGEVRLKKDFNLVFTKNDVNADFYDLLSAAPAMYRALGIIAGRMDQLNSVMDVATRQEPKLKADPTMRALIETFGLIDRVCMDALGFADNGLNSQLDSIVADQKMKKN